MDAARLFGVALSLVNRVEQCLAELQVLLKRAIFKYAPDDGKLSGERLKFPVARRVRNGNAEARQGARELDVRVQVDVRAHGAEEGLLRGLFGKLVLQLLVQLVATPLDVFEFVAPARLVEIQARKLHRGQRRDALEFELRGARERVCAKRFDQLCSKGKHERGVARSVFELCGRKLAAPIAHLLRLVNGLTEVSLDDRGEAVSVFLLARAYELAREQGVEESAALDLYSVVCP